MLQRHHSRSSYKDTIKGLEADIQHANALAAAIPRVYGGSCLQMRLSCSPLAPIFLFFTQWMDCSYIYELPSYLGLLQILVYKLQVDEHMPMSSHDRKASLREFYAVIYPSLQQLQGDLKELEKTTQRRAETHSRKIFEERKAVDDKDSEREDECGICMEACTKMVMPDCGHAMCMRCYHDWNMRSESCPFCRGSLKRFNSEDLWVLTSNDDVIDPATLAKENLRRFYIYIDSLPLTMPDNFFYVYDYII